MGFGTNDGVYGAISGATKTYIGAQDLGGPVGFFGGGGLIDEFEIHNRALTAAERSRREKLAWAARACEMSSFE